jgi:hypothetical protein
MFPQRLLLTASPKILLKVLLKVSLDTGTNLSGNFIRSFTFATNNFGNPVGTCR